MTLKQNSSVMLKHLVWLSSWWTKVILRDYTVTEQMRTCDPRFDREHSGMEYQCASVLSNGRGSQRWELVVGAQAPIRVSSTICRPCVHHAKQVRGMDTDWGVVRQLLVQINANTKSLYVDELKERRKRVVSMLDIIHKEVCRDLDARVDNKEFHDRLALENDVLVQTTTQLQTRHLPRFHRIPQEGE